MNEYNYRISSFKLENISTLNLLYSLSLFDEIGMCKPQKSVVYKYFQKVNIEINIIKATYIIDGGYLLHSIMWNSEGTFNVILLNKYILCVRRQFGYTGSVVFDRCNNFTRYIEAAEQRCRA